MRVSSGTLGYQPDARPDAETVKRLADNAKLQQAVWNVWVPEAGIRFGANQYFRNLLADPVSGKVSMGASPPRPRAALLSFFLLSSESSSQA